MMPDKQLKLWVLDCNLVGEVDECLCLFPENEMGDVMIVVDRVLSPEGLPIDLTEIPKWLTEVCTLATRANVHYVWLQAIWDRTRSK